jgi:hypothetical protein
MRQCSDSGLQLCHLGRDSMQQGGPSCSLHPWAYSIPQNWLLHQDWRPKEER